MAPRVLVSHWVHPEVTAALAEFSRPEAPSERVVWDREELLARSAGAEAFVACMADRVDGEFLDRWGPGLRIVAATLKGYDNFDAKACAARGVWLTIVPEAIVEPTAELAVGLTIGLLRRVGEADRSMRERPYEGWRPRLYGGTLRGAEVGILGMGALGREIARLLAPFGAHLRYADPVALPADTARALALERREVADLVAGSDVVIVALPLAPATVGLLDRELIGRVRPGACVVNVGRGSTVDEEAIAAALADGRLGGYAADVFAGEDWALPNHPDSIPPALLEHPRTLITPHLGSAVDRVRLEMSLTAVRQVRQALAGDEPEHAAAWPG